MQLLLPLVLQQLHVTVRRRRRRRTALIAAASSLLMARAAHGPAFTVVGKAANQAQVVMDWSERKRSLRADDIGCNEFYLRYRMDVNAFEKLVELIRGDLPKCDTPAEILVSMAIRWFAGGSVYDIVDLHGVHRSTFDKYIWTVVKAINAHFELPLLDAMDACDVTYLQSVATRFENKTSGVLRGCVGAIDGCMIKVVVKGGDAVKYYCRKGVC